MVLVEKLVEEVAVEKADVLRLPQILFNPLGFRKDTVNEVVEAVAPVAHVGTGDEEAASWFEDAGDFFDGGGGVIDVFDDVTEEDEVKGVGGEG